jgi:8-oxo-dGTP pyrophosphatase MutT (NUDIX family)
MDFKKLISILNDFDSIELPGEVAHTEIAPYRNARFNAPKKDPRHAAVLVHLYQYNNETYFTLIKRSTYDGAHSGQIAFPGGKAEKEDLNLTETALREAREETNITSESLKVVGLLTKIYIPPSNFYVTPVISISKIQPNYIAEEHEVDTILEVKLADLLDDNNRKTIDIKLGNGTTLNTPSFSLVNETVWGATAMILNELRVVLQSK